MGKLTANFQAMRTAAEDTRTCHNALVREHDGLVQFLGTVKDQWAGAASDQWQTAQKDWDNACDEVHGILMNLYNALELALDNYSGTEQALRKLWGG